MSTRDTKVLLVSVIHGAFDPASKELDRTNSLVKRLCSWDAWVVHLVKRLSLDFGSSQDLRVVSWSPELGSALGMESA